jgi:hypothetical protein
VERHLIRNEQECVTMSDDVVQRLRVWLVRCRRHVHPPSVTEIGDTLSLAIAEIQRMRGKVEWLQGERRERELSPENLKIREPRGRGRSL